MIVESTVHFEPCVVNGSQAVQICRWPVFGRFWILPLGNNAWLSRCDGQQGCRVMQAAKVSSNGGLILMSVL